MAHFDELNSVFYININDIIPVTGIFYAYPESEPQINRVHCDTMPQNPGKSIVGVGGNDNRIITGKSPVLTVDSLVKREKINKS